MAVFWVVPPCSLVEVYNVSEVLAASVIKEMSVNTRRYNPEDSRVKIFLFANTSRFNQQPN
jgi:hypothetical protein